LKQESKESISPFRSAFLLHLLFCSVIIPSALQNNNHIILLLVLYSCET